MAGGERQYREREVGEEWERGNTLMYREMKCIDIQGDNRKREGVTENIDDATDISSVSFFASTFASYICVV
eukprot:990971-Amorphochlora_amoeboformis.AAC.1